MDKIADNDDKTFISQKISEVVLKPLLLGFIGEEIRSDYNLNEDWFS